MLVLGMTMVIYQSVGFELSVMPGDLGDGRFNNYLLEHGYLCLIKGNMPYWNAPFFFPEKHVISYSDNLFGALPIYVFLRFLADRETAFQLWYLILVGLNFVGAYYALKKLKVSIYAASVGAFIYAFSLILLMQTDHIQLLPRFVAPLAIVRFYLWLQGNNNKHFYISIFLLTYQFYCAIYLGYFLVYILIAMYVVHLIKERKIDVMLQLFNSKKDFIRTSIFVCIILSLLGILFYPYYLRSIDENGYPSMLVIERSTLHLWNYFFTSDRSVFWGWSNYFVEKNFVQAKFLRRENYIFIGMLPYIFLTVAFFMFRKDVVIRFFLTILFVIFILTFSLFDFSIYPYIVYIIPGARAIRVLSRYIVIAVFIWSIISAFFLDRILSDSNKYTTLFMFVLPVLLVMDNIHVSGNDGVLKSTCQQRCTSVVAKYKKAKYINPSAKAFDFCFNTDSIKDNRKRIRTAIYGQMDAMMASQLIGVPCVNGYSAKPPPDYLDCFISPSENKLRAWLYSNRVRTTVKEKYSVQDILIFY